MQYIHGSSTRLSTYMRDGCVAILIVTASETYTSLSSKCVIELLVVWLDVVIGIICNTPPKMSHTCSFHQYFQHAMARAHTHSRTRAERARQSLRFLQKRAPHTDQPTGMRQIARKSLPPTKHLVKDFG